MHYIRLLRPPAVASSRAGSSLSLVLTITTDLGESFLHPDKPIDISVGVETVTELVTENEVGVKGEAGSVSENQEDSGSGSDESLTEKRYQQQLHPLAASARDKKGKAGRPSWTAGLRVLKLDAPIPKRVMALLSNPSTVRKRLFIHTTDKRLSAISARQIVSGSQGLIVPAWVDIPETSQDFPHMSIRKLYAGQDNDGSPVSIEVEEEIGESIARHVWDAGLATVAFLAETCMKDDKGGQPEEGALIGALRRTLQPQSRVLELGTGVGILGIGLATVLRNSPSSIDSSILLTDLPEAEERAVSNMELSRLLAAGDAPAMAAHGNGGGDDNSSRPRPTPSLQLAYENLDWDEGCQGVFGPKVTAGRPWDLVVLSDCTYNVDMLPALVRTLSALQSLSAPSPLRVLLARKPRHPSEEALFTLLSEHGWSLQASDSLPLPVLYGEDEVLEIYLYVKGEQ